MKIHPVALFNKLNLGMLALLKPLGIWGIGALAVIDSASIPVPIDALVIDYVVHDHAKFLLYCFMAAVGSGRGQPGAVLRWPGRRRAVPAEAHQPPAL